MKQKMLFTALVLMFIVVALNGCCNRCKNKPDGYVPTAVAGDAGSQGSSSGLYSSRQATK